MNDNWIKNHTFHHSNFSNIEELVEAKRAKNLKISLCFPTLNEEATIAKEIVIMKSELVQRYPLIDEIAVIDSGSTDRTREVAKSYGADVYLAEDILPNLEKFKGKGENLWKALYVLDGDIIVYLDADIKNIHHRFAYGLLGPLLLDDEIKITKGFYDRPIAVDTNQLKPSGGGRVTELLIRPLFSLFYPELTQVIQPLSGEYAGFREIFENVAFPIGYGIETSMLLDIYYRWGLGVLAQVDLDRRVHRNQSTLALGRMSFGILQTFFNRVEREKAIQINKAAFQKLIQFSVRGDDYKPDIYDIIPQERPPIIELDEYKQKFHL